MHIPSTHSSVSLFVVFAVSLGAGRCDETATFSPTPPRIVGNVADGTLPPPAVVPEMPDYRVLDTIVREQGGRSITIHRVEDPRLPLPTEPPSAPKIDPDDPEVQAWLARQREEAKPVHLALVSATVYDHGKTLVHWSIPGKPERSFEAWSNIDFNHLSGFGSFEAEGMQFGLIMGVGNIDTEAWRKLLAKYGRTYAPPASPDLPAERPGFALTKGDAGDKEGMALIKGLHDIYAREKDRLVAACEGRERARKEREAYLKAHPPKPKDITIHFWRPNREEATTTDGEGGAQ